VDLSPLPAIRTCLKSTVGTMGCQLCPITRGLHVVGAERREPCMAGVIDVSRVSAFRQRPPTDWHSLNAFYAPTSP